MMSAVAATVAASEQWVEIVGERRRAYYAAFRARVVAQSLVPGASVQDLARRHGICKSLIYRWRRMVPAAVPVSAASAVGGPDILSGTTGQAGPEPGAVASMPLEFVPIGVLERSKAEAPVLAAEPARPTAMRQEGRQASSAAADEDQPGTIRVDLACGTRLRVDAFVNERALRRVPAVLRTAP
jgi:transposase